MKNLKILIVDDEPDILDFLEYNLEKEGYEVFTAGDGAEGVSVAEKHEPDLIVLDIMMPEMDGVEACKFLRTKEQFKNTLIVFLTAREEDFTEILALEAGGDDYIIKPIRPRVFISRIKAILRRAGRLEPEENKNVLKFGDLKINEKKMQVKIAGKKVKLAKKEYKLLLLLVSQPGKVFPREEIFYEVWGTDIMLNTRTIDVHIRKLREKIGNNLIVTIKGIGYKFEF